MFDIAIIGSGPAGVSAAINAKILNKSFIWLASRSSSKKVDRAELIRNYPAMPDISGADFAAALRKHTESLEIELTEKVVTGVYNMGEHFSVLAGNDTFDAKTVILCLGVESVKPIEGEEKYLGRGVSYCATCDGFLYKGKKIAVLCYDKHFEHEVEYLCGVAEKAYVMPLYKGYEIKAENAEVILKTPKEFVGDLKVRGVVFDGRKIDVDGVFVLRGAVSPATLVRGLETDGGHIVVKRDCSTNIAGIFAAGDCTGRPYQYVKAAGEGNVAVHSAVEYLAGK